ncbi:MAG: T9SS type A sorting domain-containing protein [Saprospiraceae bacterium]|nr:T9SS type A sorting domain-containing protein [Saprospiraceae bacterium]
MINRIENMPDQPVPYNLRNWKEVARKYDTFVYDLNKSGEFLPLVFIKDQGANYPENPSFGLKTYVGSFDQTSGEAINILPSLVGATLVGIDKSNQNGNNWIVYSQDFFNHLNSENIYLNNVGARSGTDWWYDMMPNIYFYQLYDLYGDIGEATFQFNSVADRMQAAVRQMGGSDTPWQRASMNYRAWDFVNAKPLTSGVIEPEAAGAFAWLLYHAYKKTGNKEYLKGSEWSLEFLTNLGANPSYELQLPYGAYVAAKMNAEIGTNYDIEKLIFWIFNRGPLRGWGTIVGNWGGLDVSGLVGEANDQGNDYAFQLNGLQHAAALVPLVRYDKRFARNIAKWVLNLANASRLMYPGFLPANLQDASEWSMVHDPDGVIGYEALRERLNGLSPVATGDALRGQWAATNLSLYSSSSIGYLGSIIESTNVEKILLIDLLKTDFFNDDAYPSYLLFNPFAEEKEVILSLGEQSSDVYDAITEEFILHDVQGDVLLTLPAGAVMSLVYVPSDGQLETKNNQLLSAGVVIDYYQTQVPFDRPPRIQSLATEQSLVELGDTINIYGKAIDQETKNLTYEFEVVEGHLLGDGPGRRWILPQTTGIYQVRLTVADAQGQVDSAILEVEVVAEVNLPPQINDLVTTDLYTPPGNTINITCIATDPNGDSLSYLWEANDGEITNQGNLAAWTSPGNAGIADIKVIVSDVHGAFTERVISILVIDYIKPNPANLIAYYPFNGDANDVSGNNLHGVISGSKLTSDLQGNHSSAYFFDGNNDHITIANTDILNFQKGITLSLWITPLKLPGRESFIISHGSWQNRWKLSIIPDRNIRWTLKNVAGQVGDLDSRTKLEVDTTYHVTASYDGHFLALYINGRLETFSEMSGDINQTSIDMEIAQILPDDPSFNFGGVLDEIKIFDYALAPDTIIEIFDKLTTASTDVTLKRPEVFVFPNPVEDQLIIQFSPPEIDSYRISIFDQWGRLVFKQDRKDLAPLMFDIHDYDSGVYFLVIHTKSNMMTKKILKM